MQKDKLYYKNGQVISFNPLQIQQGLADGLIELSEEEIAALNNPPVEELSTLLRNARDARLAATDKYLLSDYPISAENLAAIKIYRQALRDLPAQEGTPFDGGGDATPWPAIPQL